MDKELEEAIVYIKEVMALAKILPNGEVTIQEKELKTLETVLKELDNSIPKEKIEEKIYDLKREKIKLSERRRHGRDGIHILNKIERMKFLDIQIGTLKSLILVPELKWYEGEAELLEGK